MADKISVRSAEKFVRYAESLGMDRASLLAQAGITRPLHGDPDAQMPFETLLRLQNVIAREMADPLFGFRFATHVRIEDFEILSYATAGVETLLDAWKRVELLYPFWTKAARLSAGLDRRGFVVEYEVRSSGVEDVWHDVAMTLALVVVFSRQLAVAAPEIREVRLRGFRGAALLQPMERFFGSPLRDGQSRDQVVFAPTTASIALRPDRPQPWGPNRFASLEGDLRHRVHVALHAHPTPRAASADEIASLLGMSLRTFQRRLEAEGAGFRDIAHEVILERAKELLAQSRLSIGEVAFALGYAETSAFVRAFRAWTGSTPGSWRRVHMS